MRRKKIEKGKKDNVVETPKAIKKLAPEEEIVGIVDELKRILFQLPVSGPIQQRIQGSMEELKLHVRRILAPKTDAAPAEPTKKKR